MNQLERIGRRFPALVVALSLAAVLLIAAAKYYIGPGFTFLLLYLVPVFLVAWLAGRRSGLFVSVVSAAAYFYAEGAGHGFESRPLIPLFNFAMRLSAFLFITYFVSALRRSLDHERELARTDALTGVLNRRSFFETADMEIRRARRNRHPFTVAYIDIDDFKEINDRYGHLVGSHVLMEMATVILLGVRDTDVVTRYGGDEFVVVLPETSVEMAQRVAERIREKVAANTFNGGRALRLRLTTSIGVACCPQHAQSPQQLISNADAAMYEAKAAHKNCVRFAPEPPS